MARATEGLETVKLYFYVEKKRKGERKKKRKKTKMTKRGKEKLISPQMLELQFNPYI